MPLHDLAKLFTADGPFVSVYVDTQAVTHDAMHQLDLRRRAICDELRELGADAATVDAVSAVIRHGNGGQSQLVVAAHGEVRHDRHLPVTVDQEVVWYGALPYLLPEISAVQAGVPHVVVLADRTGADVLAYDGSGGAPVHTATVAGSHDEIERNDPGGWSQRRYQERAEDSWAGNAREVAEQVGRIVTDVRARLVLLNGDVRAVQLLQEHLPEHVKPLADVIDAGGGRAVDGSQDVVAEAVLERVAAKAAAELERLLEKFQEERGQHDRACEGAQGTVDCVMQAKVETLLVHDDPADRRTAWFGPEPTHVALDRRSLADLGVAEPEQGRLVDVLVRGALGTGADVRVVPPGGRGVPADGVGAILRW